jgi:hypothetical protein
MHVVQRNINGVTYHANVINTHLPTLITASWLKATSYEKNV